MENNHNDVISPVPEETVSVKPEQETVSPSEEPSEGTPERSPVKSAENTPTDGCIKWKQDPIAGRRVR